MGVIRLSDGVHDHFMRFSCPRPHIMSVDHLRRHAIKEWLKPGITESEAGIEVTSYLPAELDRD
jgi:hypothetical protein